MNAETVNTPDQEQITTHTFHPDDLLIAQDIVQKLNENDFGNYHIEPLLNGERNSNVPIEVILHFPLRDSDPFWEAYYTVTGQARFLAGSESEILDQKKELIEKEMLRLIEHRNSNNPKGHLR